MDKKEDISIACCLWGDWPKHAEAGMSGVEYVNRLYRAVERNTTLPHQFFCFTDSKQLDQFDDGIILNTIELPSRMREIAKLYVYKPGIGLTGRIIVMDLDTIILKNIDEFLVRKEEFIVRKAFNPRFIKAFDGIGGDLISFDEGFGEFIWDTLKNQTSWMNQMTGGDERKAYKLLLKDRGHKITFWQDILPGRYISFKNHLKPIYRSTYFNENCKRREIKKALKNVSLISFHGQPRPHELLVKSVDCVKENWK